MVPLCVAIVGVLGRESLVARALFPPRAFTAIRRSVPLIVPQARAPADQEWD